MADHPLRGLPSVDTLLGVERAVSVAERQGRAAAVNAVRAALADARQSGAAEDAGALLARAARHLDRPPSLRPALNATGVVVHTNLGRAPLAAAAIERAARVAGGYSNLEYDLAAGARGSRHAHLGSILSELTGAEDGMAVNNNAAAVMLVLAALAEGREVPLSRGELIEIGDGFRIPDVLAQSGARLVEVGSTNRTRIGDYAGVLGPETGAILRVHQSNFRIVGFTDAPSLHELAELAADHRVPVIDDLGSGQLLDLPDLADEPTARSSIEAGAQVVCFSGDKLLGGPQAGVIVGTGAALERIRRHPLARAMRIDKLSLAALEATLELYRDPQRALREVPVLAAAAESADTVRARAERLAARLEGEVVTTTARVGGGAVPLLEIESFACALDDGEALAATLRGADPPVVSLVREGRVLLDCRTLTDEQCLQISL